MISSEKLILFNSEAEEAVEIHLWNLKVKLCHHYCNSSMETVIRILWKDK